MQPEQSDKYERERAMIERVRHRDMDGDLLHTCQLAERFLDRLEMDAASSANGERAVAGSCSKCGGDVFHREGLPGEYDHECQQPCSSEEFCRSDDGCMKNGSNPTQCLREHRAFGEAAFSSPSTGGVRIRNDWETSLYESFDSPMTHKDVAAFIRAMFVHSSTVPMETGAVYLIDGKPHRLCKCDQMSPTCPRGAKRSMQTCGFGHCMLPVNDTIAVSATQHRHIAGMQREADADFVRRLVNGTSDRDWKEAFTYAADLLSKNTLVSVDSSGERNG